MFSYLSLIMRQSLESGGQRPHILVTGVFDELQPYVAIWSKSEFLDA